MQDTGCVRRVDGFGRIVIPRTVRELLEIKEGNPMEIWIDKEKNEIILKKYLTNR